MLTADSPLTLLQITSTFCIGGAIGNICTTGELYCWHTEHQQIHTFRLVTVTSN
jgi:hypothetical protein